MTLDSRSFLDLYVQHTGRRRAEFVADVLRRTLYPHARLFTRLLTALDAQYFHPDYEFIEDVSLMRRPADFSAAVRSYLEHPRNRSFPRRRLRLRISVRRMLKLANHVSPPTLPPELASLLQPGGTRQPFWRPNRSAPSIGDEQKDGL
ncbi:MAG: hypothetical protein WDM96_05780 [Lacunisphaera sp.]